MIKSEVKIGGRYVAKVSRSLTVVEIVSTPMTGGWRACNLRTGRVITIRSARKLRREMSEEEYTRWSQNIKEQNEHNVTSETVR